MQRIYASYFKCHYPNTIHPLSIKGGKRDPDKIKMIICMLWLFLLLFDAKKLLDSHLCLNFLHGYSIPVYWPNHPVIEQTFLNQLYLTKIATSYCFFSSYCFVTVRLLNVRMQLKLQLLYQLNYTTRFDILEEDLSWALCH